MKKLTKLNEIPEHFIENISESDKQSMPTVKRMLLNQIGASVSDRPEEAIDLYGLGIKIKNTNENEIEIEDSEFYLLKKICEKNRIGWLSHFHAQILLMLKECEK